MAADGRGGTGPRRAARGHAGPGAAGAGLSRAESIARPEAARPQSRAVTRGAAARDEPGTWDTGAGALEHGESFEAAVAHEVREEYTAEARKVETAGVRNIPRGDRGPGPCRHRRAAQARRARLVHHG
ncbi:NUDIX domain-containing protein [Streptomyces sp. LZ34]